MSYTKLERDPVPDDVEAAAGGGDDDAGAEIKPVSETTPKERIAGGVAVVAVVTSVAAMAVASSPFVVAGGVLSCIAGPYVYYQQTKLSDIQDLQETHEAAKREVDRLTAENVRLKKSVDELKGTVDRLEELEKAFDVITQTQGQSVNEFAKQVEENRQILARMKSNLKSNLLQNVLNVILRSDEDRNYTIDDHEIDDIIHRIENINGIEVHDERFKKLVHDTGGNINSVMMVLKNLMRDDVPEEEKIFTTDD